MTLDKPINAAPLRVGVSARTLDKHVGGNTTYVRYLYEGLATRGVIGHALGAGSGLIHSRSLRYAAHEALRMQSAARRQRCALLHFPADTGPVSRGSTPTVLTLHGAAQLHEPDVRTALAGRIWLERTRLAARHVDAIVTVSNSSKEDVLQILGKRAETVPVTVIPLGVDLERFRPATPEEIVAAKEAHEVTRPFVFYLGNIEPRKNIVPLVEAIDLLNAEGNDIELLVGGKPAWNYEASLAAIDASPHSRRLGWLTDDDVRALMSSCGAFAFPSRYEGFGLPVLEAMACGAPVMCTRRGSLPEVAGDIATYAEGIDRDAIADALTRTLATADASTSSKGIDHAHTFSWEATAASHHALFDRLAGGSGA